MPVHGRQAHMEPYVLYPWIKAFHLISMVAWMAGMFYLPRLYVYHHGAPIGSAKIGRAHV